MADRVRAIARAALRGQKIPDYYHTLTAENKRLNEEVKEGVRLLREHCWVYQDDGKTRTCMECGTDYKHDPNLPPEEIEPCYYPDCKLAKWLQRNGGK